jgi:hypothetical protein
MARKRRQYLKYFLQEKYGTEIDAADAIGINYFRLVRFISRTGRLNEADLRAMRVGLKISHSELEQIISR